MGSELLILVGHTACCLRLTQLSLGMLRSMLVFAVAELMLLGHLVYFFANREQ